MEGKVSLVAMLVLLSLLLRAALAPVLSSVGPPPINLRQRLVQMDLNDRHSPAEPEVAKHVPDHLRALSQPMSGFGSRHRVRTSATPPDRAHHCPAASLSVARDRRGCRLSAEPTRALTGTLRTARPWMSV